MKKTVLKKYLTVNTSIVLISFLFLGIMLWVVVSQYWKKEKHELLMENAKAISKLIEGRTFERNGHLYITDSESMETFISTFASNINAEIFVTDINGDKIFCSEGEMCKHSKITIPQYIISEAIAGSYIGTTTLSGIYSNVHYVVGIPISVQNESERTGIGVVFTAIDTNTLYSFRMDIFQIFIVVAIIAFIMSFLAISILSYRMTRPLREMSIAAKSFGEGDFSGRIKVISNDEVGELATAFNNMANSLSVSEGVRRSFIANVSHELKTPMTTISGFIDGILDGTIPMEKQTCYLYIVSSEIKRLSRMVKSMLDLSQIDSGNLNINSTRFDMSKVIIDVLILFEEKIAEKKVSILGIQNFNSVIVNGDIDMIYQVIYNLIENAVKFVNQNGSIEFFCGVQDLQIVTWIRNSGQGIPKEELNMIFDRFYKTDKSRSQDKSGMGLGLYIVKMIIKYHNGKINVSSVLNKYTEFKFSLPNSPSE